MRTGDSRSEHEIQSAFITMCDLAGYRKRYAVPNGSWLGRDQKSRAIQMAKLKREGFSTGVPDVCFPVGRHGFIGLYVEFKSPKRHDGPTDDQLLWLQWLRDEKHVAFWTRSDELAFRVAKEYHDGSAIGLGAMLPHGFELRWD